jgi:hypothetical protein
MRCSSVSAILSIKHLYLGELTQFNIQTETDQEDAIKDVSATSSDGLLVTWSCRIHEQYLH